MYKCSHCGYEVEVLPTYTEYYPYGNGYIGQERDNDMCDCGGDMIEGEHCERCGEFTEQPHNGLCDVCFDDMYG